MTNQPACDEAGTHGKLACVATHGCWCNSKVIHRTKKYWGLKTATGKYEHARQFLVLPCCSICSALLLPLFFLLFDLLLLPFTQRFHSLNLLFSLLVFVVATLSRSSRCSLGVFAFLTRYFRYWPSSLLANLTPPALPSLLLLVV